MKVKTLNFSESTKGHNDIIDITRQVESKVKESGLVKAASLYLFRVRLRE